jgi:hypothetical protein
MAPTTGTVQYDRNGIVAPDSSYEKIVILPTPDQADPCIHAWADARFAADIMMEHALFFVLLMPPETCQAERAQASKFQAAFTDLIKKIDANGVPTTSSLKSFCQTVIDAIKPFIDYKQKMLTAQTNGALRSLVWPLFFEHTLDEANRWVSRLTQLASAQSEYDRAEVIKFWAEIVEEHARFEAHLLDPDEYALIDRCNRNSKDFQAILALCKGPTGCPAPVSGSDPILIAAQGLLSFEVAASRGIEDASIKSIIDPRLADHLRRETLKFVDEVKRAV